MQSQRLSANGVIRIVPSLAIGLWIGLLPMAAQAADSRYQKIDLDTDCKTLSASTEGDSASFLCHGPGRMPFVEDYGDLRSSVTYGISEQQGERIWQSFGPFNEPAETIEWRYGDSASRPIATIRRWSVQTGSAPEERDWSILVVSRVAQDGIGACTTGYVDARPMENANVIARIIADAGAKNFRCWEDEPVYRPDDDELRGVVSR